MARGQLKQAVDRTKMLLEQNALLVSVGMPDDLQFIAEQIVLDIIQIYDIREERR